MLIDKGEMIERRREKKDGGRAPELHRVCQAQRAAYTILL